MTQITFDLKSQSLIGGEGPLKLEWVSDGTFGNAPGSDPNGAKKKKSKKTTFRSQGGRFSDKILN